MTHEYFAVRIRKAIEKDSRPRVTPTFNGGDFAPDLVNRLKEHLRRVELAQIKAVQEYKEVVRTQRTPGAARPSSKVWQQIEAARKAAR
jgi:hypothetical protein